MRRPVSAALILLLLAAVAACTKSQPSPRTVTSVITDSSSPKPVDGGPVHTAATTHCPFIARQSAANIVGMRLARMTLQRVGGAVVGCRIYAIQGTALARSERLPPANQPVVQVRLTRYHSPTDAYNAVALAARAGTAPQQANFGGTTGVCFQTAFYPKDKGQDWSCVYNHGSTMVRVDTVVVSPALNAIQLTRKLTLP